MCSTSLCSIKQTLPEFTTSTSLIMVKKEFFCFRLPNLAVDELYVFYFQNKVMKDEGISWNDNI